MNETTDLSIFESLSLITILKAMLILAAGWLLANFLRSLFRKTMESKISAHALAMYSRVIYYGVLIIFTVSTVDALGFDLSVLLGAAGILTVAIGFASQTSASNLISGLFLLGEKPFQIGDVLRIGNDTGEVISIDLLSVKLRTFDNLFVRIPNESLIKTTVVNLTRYPIRRIDLLVGVAYKEELARVKAVLLELANDELRVLEEPTPFCIVTGFGASSVDLQLSVWTQRELVRDVKSDMYERIKARFDAEQIEIPFPHLSLYAGSATGPFPVAGPEAEGE
ncbi:mechanosensitive ion channel family protein [Halioxenophilus sp. WMMB6]|uniref:mechanosensitive ion channel family protein n=1 Tax=Halioxenophilus sp. WMMB6 TaxID=3073815 RepID=UPI00295EF475|nr:mechanosensitive ion channel family protein [Halioxenophilus sp. WMMB6]